ncbi:MAG: PLD nuclease N-terminal domain-containing protein [bacterium]
MRVKFFAASIITTLLFLLPFTSYALTQQNETQEVLKQVAALQQALSTGQSDTITALLSPNASIELRNAITKTLSGKKILFIQEITRFEQISPEKIKVEGPATARGTNWTLQGFTNYYVFEKIDGKWLILDTDFHQNFTTDGFMKKNGWFIWLLVGTFVLVFPLSIFWLFMLIDCIQRPVNNKVIWIIVLVVFSIFGAVIYFFTVRKTAIQHLKQTNP